MPAEHLGIETHQHTRGAHAVHLNLSGEAGGVDEREAVDLTGLLGVAVTRESDEGIVVVRGGAALAVDALRAELQMALDEGALLGPAALQMEHFEIHRVEIHAGGVEALDIEGRLAVVLHADAAGDNIELREGGVDESDLSAGEAVLADDLQRVGLVIGVGVGRGQTGQRRLAGIDLVGLVADIGGRTAVFSADRQRGGAEVSGALAGIFDAGGVKRHALLLRSLDIGAEGCVLHLMAQVVKIGIRNGCTIIIVEQIACGADAEGVGGSGRIQLEYAVLGIKNDGHSGFSFVA